MTRADQGFSLVEVMIVVAVLAVLSVGATLAIGQRDRTARASVTLVQDLAARLRTEAVIARQPRLMRIAPSVISVWHPGADGSWSEVEAHDLDSTLDGAPGYGATLDETGALRVMFLPDRRSSAFALRVDTRQGVWRCATDGWAPLDCEADA